MLNIKFDFQLFTDTTVPDALVCKAWAKDTWKEAERQNYFSKFIGTGPNAIIQKKEDLRKEKGDQITLSLMMRLVGEGVTGDNTLEGNEEALDYRDFSVTIDQIRHAVRLEGEFEEQKSKLAMRTDAKEGLALWMKEKVEKEIVNALLATPDVKHVIFAGSATSKATITNTDKFSADLISIAARKAKNLVPKIRRPHVEGKDYYVMVIDSYQARDLKNDEKWLAAQRNCAERGSKNPIFTGMLGVYDGVIIHEYEEMPRETNGSVKVGTALLLGCQAAVQAIAKTPDWKEKKFDYDNKYGVAIRAIWGHKKAVFEHGEGEAKATEDFAVVTVITASEDD